MGVIEETLRIETGHMMEVEIGIKITEKDLVRIEETVDLTIEVDQPLGIKLKTEVVIYVENQDIL